MTASRGRKRSRRGIAGTVYQRGAKWAYLIDLGADPLTGKRRRDSRSGFPTENAAWDGLVEANTELRTHTYVKNAPRTVREFFDEWLAAMKTALKPTTHSNYTSYAQLLRHTDNRRSQTTGHHGRNDQPPLLSPPSPRQAVREHKPDHVRGVAKGRRSRS